jgi:signal peptidase
MRQVAHRFGWAILIVCLLAAYLLLNFSLPNIHNSNLNLYVFQPLMWSAIVMLTVWLWSLEGETLRWLDHKRLIGFAAIVGGIQVAASILAGFLSGFGNSPYSHALIMIGLNLLFVATKLVGIEIARWYLGKTIGRINAGLGYVIAWLVPLMLLTPMSMFSLLGGPENAFRLIGGTFIPTASENLLAAYLAILAGPLGSIAYLGVIQAFEWLSPILPDLPWLGTAFIGVLVPVIGLIVLTRDEATPSDDPEQSTRKEKDERASPVSWLIVAAFAVGTIWFNSGALGVRPSLISGNSMNPMLYPGDVVITRNISPASIQEGDVIRFHRDGIDIVHRVRAVQNHGATLLFITRGDNNNVDDDPVLADQLEGKVILTIPKIGWIGILFRRALAWAGSAP